MTPQSNPDTVKPPRKGSKLTVLLVTLLSVVALATGGYLFMRKRGVKPQQSQQPVSMRVLHLESFVLNLDDPEQKTYLRIGIDLGIEEAAGYAKEKAEAPTAPVRDAILSVLSEAKASELSTAAGKAKLKKDIQQCLNDRLPALRVREVYFTDFLIQN